MLQSRDRAELLSFLKKSCEELEIVLLPDFFQDRILNLDCDPQTFSSIIENVAKHKGGSIDEIGQTDLNGGNAINTASALAALGAKVIPIVNASEFGLRQIEFQFEKYHVDTSHVKLVSKPSKTTALEFKTDAGKANVMLRDLGSLIDFGPADLTNADYEAIENADYVCIFNWAGTKKFGTQLAQAVFSLVKSKGKGKTYFDTADPTPNKEKAPDLLENVLKSRQIDILSLNENEAVFYANLLGYKQNDQNTSSRLDELSFECAKVLAKTLTSRIDLHTTTFSASIKKENEVVVPAFKIDALRATGAGDAWNAGNIIADAYALSDECRLILANAVSACYLSDPEGLHPTRQKLTKFIKNLKQ